MSVPALPARRDAGFTLLEVLAALVVLGFLMAGLSGGVRLGLRAWDQQERAVAGHGDLDAADRALRRLIAGIDPGSLTRTSFVTGSAGRLAMVAALPDAAPARMAEVALGLDGDRLVMRWTPQEPGVRLGPPPSVEEAELLRGVSQVRFAYWPRPGGRAGAAGWRDAWDRQDPPALIRVRLAFADGRRWPDIVAPVMRERLGSR
jgi:general secretion pathway protein J